MTASNLQSKPSSGIAKGKLATFNRAMDKNTGI
jgi:hypothetical protein